MSKINMGGYLDLLSKFYPDLSTPQNAAPRKRTARGITIQVTDTCNMACSYCYQKNKGAGKMSVETGKKIVDWLFSEYEKDDKNNLINKDTHSIVFDFIGGEPLINVEVIQEICDYFVKRCVIEKHPWLYTWRGGITSNGTLYFRPEVQKFLKKYQNFISLSITIDGPKEVNDSCRKYPNGNGSYDDIIEAVRHYRDNYCHELPATKITISKDNLEEIDKIIDFLYAEGFKNVQANTIYEEHWTYNHAKIFYQKLKQMADKMLSEGRDDLMLWLFDEDLFIPCYLSYNENWCGGAGDMIAFDPQGNMYPCLRYMDSSINGEREILTVGNLEEGFRTTEKTKKIVTELQAITRRSQSTDECFYCPIAKGCGWCSAWNYQENGTPNCRSTNICPMHKARALANVYYWNLKYVADKTPRRLPLYLSQKEALKIIDEKEYDMLLNLSMARIEL